MRFALSLTLILTLVLSLTGCGGDSITPAQPTSPTTTPTAPPLPPLAVAVGFVDSTAGRRRTVGTRTQAADRARVAGSVARRTV